MIPLPLRRIARSSPLALSLALGVLCTPLASADEVEKLNIKLPPGAVLAPAVKGKHVTMYFRQSDWDILKDKTSFMEFYDQVYECMEELTANSPPMIIRGHQDLGAWGTAGMDGIRIEWGSVSEFMNDFNVKKISFGAIHEIGHVFDARDFPRWYITPGGGGEMFANFKLSYAVERLLTKDTPFVINFGPGGDQKGYEFNDRFFPPNGVEYLKSDKPWDDMSVDALHAFHHQFVRRFGWDVYKKWFRVYQEIEKQKDGRAPGEPKHPTRIQLACALLSKFSGEDLIPTFKEWRMPVTQEDIDTVSKRYKVDEVCAKVDERFMEEFLKGDIHLDPMSLSIRPMKAPNGRTGFTIFNIFGDSENVQIRYTIGGLEPDATAKVYAGKPIAAEPGATIKAVLFVKGAKGVQLTTTAEIPK